MASDNTIEITIKAVDQASDTLEQIKQEGASVADELQKRLGTFIAPDQAKQLGEAIAAATATGGKNIDDATQQAIKVLAGLSNQIKETNTQIAEGTPISERATALLEAFGVKATTATAAISKNGDEAIKAAADQEKLAASITKTNATLDAQREKFGVQQFVGPPLPEELRSTGGLLPSKNKLGSSQTPNENAFLFSEELQKQRFAAQFVGPLQPPGANGAVDAAAAQTAKLTAEEQALADATKKAFAEQTALSESFQKVGQAAGLSGAALDQFVAANIASANASKKAGEEQEKTAQGAEKSKESMSGLALGVIAVNQALELMEKVVGPLVHALEHVSEDAGKFEQQVVGLESTLRVFHKTASADSLIEFSDDMRKASAVSRELVIDVEQTLLKFSDLGRGADATGEQLKKMTAIVIALAKTENLPPSSVARQLASFLTNPQATSIGRGVNLPNVALDERPALVIKRLGGNVEIANDQLNTFVGSQQKLAAATEQIGHILGERMNTPLQKMNEVLAAGVEHIGEFLKQNALLAEGLAITGNAVSIALGSLEKLALILSTLALIKMSGLAKELGILASALLPFATPALAVGVFLWAKNFLDASHAAQEAIDNLDPAKVADRLKKLQDALKVQQLVVSDPNDPSVKVLKQKIADTEKLLEDFKKGPAFQAVPEAKLFSTFPSAGGSDDPGTLRAQAIERATKEIQEASKDQAQALIASQTEVKAEGEKLLFSATNNIDHLVNAIDLGRLAIIQKTNAEINTKLRALAKKELGGTATVEDLRKEAPELVTTVETDARKKQAQELQKFDQANVQTLRQAREAAAKANIDLLSATATVQQSLIDNDQAQLKILQDLNAPLEQQLALIKSIGVAQIAQAEDRIKIAQQGIRDLQAKPDAGSAANLAQQQLLTAEIQKQRTLQQQVPLTTLKSATDAQSTAVKRVTTELQAQQTILESQKASDERRIVLLNEQAQSEGKQRAPVAELLEIAGEIDKLQDQILQKKIAVQQAEVDRLRTQREQNLVSQEAVDLAEAQLKSLQQLAENVNTEVQKTTAALKQEALGAADQLSTTLADNIISGLETGLKGGKKGILKFMDDLVISAGKAFLVQGLTESLKSVTLPLIESQQKEGERSPTSVTGLIFGFAKAGVSQAIGGVGKDKELEKRLSQFDARDKAEGVERRAALASDSNKQLAVAADASKTAADFLKQAAIDLSNAAAKLSGSPTVASKQPEQQAGPTTQVEPVSGLTAEQLGNAIDAQIGQRNEIQRIVPQNPQEAAQQAEQLRVANSQLQALIELRSSLVAEIGKPQTVKLEEPKIAERDITGQTTAIQPVRIIDAPVLETNANISSVSPEAVSSQQAEAPSGDALEPAASAIVQSSSESAQALGGSAAALSQSATAITQAAAQLQTPSNVQLGPSDRASTQIVDAIENIGEGDKSVNASNVSSLSLPSTVENNIGGVSTSSVGDASFSTLQGLLGTASGLAGGQNAAAFGKVGGGIGILKQGFDLAKLLGNSGLFSGGSSAPGFGAGLGGLESASGFGAGIDPFGSGVGAGLGAGAEAGGGLFSSIGSGVSTALDFIMSLFSFAHEGGHIDKYRRMHAGGAADDVPIMAQHGEYIIQRSSAASIGKSTLDKINTTGMLPRKMHTGGEVQYFAEGGQVMMSPSVPTSHISPSAGGMAPKLSTMGKIGLGGSGRDASLKPGQETPGQNRTGITSGRDDVAPAPIHQNIYMVDQRPKSLTANDVLVIVENDMVAGNGRSARAVQNVIKRTR